MFNSIRNGALAGLAGGVPFGLMMTAMGSIQMIAGMVGSEAAAVGWGIHLMISAAIGASYGLLTGRLGRLDLRRHLLLGTTYGALWWFLGPLTLMPLMMGMPLGWHAAAMHAMLPSLLGHLVFGAVLGFAAARLGAVASRPALSRG